MRFCITRAQNYKKNQRNQRIAQKRKSGAKTSDSCDSYLGTFSKKISPDEAKHPFPCGKGHSKIREISALPQKERATQKPATVATVIWGIFSKSSPDEAKHPFPCGKGHSGKNVFKKGYKDL